MQTDWDNLIREIENGCCAIFLGHGLLSNAEGVPMHTLICNQLAAEYQELIHAYYPEENFFLFKKKQDQRRIANQLCDYYTKTVTPDLELYQMLAEIPVPLYISISPDNFLEKAIGEEAQTAYFNEPNKITEVVASREQPMVYHIFGSVQDSNSILLSHDGLFKFFKSILGEQGLPAAIKKFFREEGAGGEVIFLGFSFTKWYVQMLLRLFNLNTDNGLSRSAYLNGKPAEAEESFAEQHFQVKFIETDLRAFVTTLHQKCKERGILRKINAAKNEAAALLAEEKSQRIAQIKTLLQEKRKLRSDYEEKQTFSSDPKEISRCELEIKKIGAEIDLLWAELKSYAS